jgi:site-specific recombinase XerD
LRREPRRQRGLSTLPLTQTSAESTARAPIPPVVSLKAALDAANEYARSSKAPSTWRAYSSDWKVFQTWCTAVGVQALPATPHTVALFIAAQGKSGKAPSTLTRRLAAIRLVHRGAKVESPHDAIEVNTVLQGIRRAPKKKHTSKKKSAARDKEIRLIVDAVRPQSTRGLRDRAVLLLGFAGAFRRSELVALDCENLEDVDGGLKVHIGRSKTDQEAKGRKIAILAVPGSEYCPVQAVKDWQTVAEIQEGPLFRRMRNNDKVGSTRLGAASVALIVKANAGRAGLDEKQFAGHSLRRGFLTSAADSGASIWKMAEQSGHKSLDVLREYVEEGQLFDNHAGAKLLK